MEIEIKFQDNTTFKFQVEFYSSKNSGWKKIKKFPKGDEVIVHGKLLHDGEWVKCAFYSNEFPPNTLKDL